MQAQPAQCSLSALTCGVGPLSPSMGDLHRHFENAQAGAPKVKSGRNANMSKEVKTMKDSFTETAYLS